MSNIFHRVTLLLENPKGQVELDNPNICAEVKLCLFLFMPALEIVCRDTKILTTVRPCLQSA